MKQWLYGAGATIVAALIVAAKFFANSARKARDETAKATQRAKGEKAAREHVEDVTEATNEVDDDIRSKSDGDVGDELREYARDRDKGD